MDESRSKSEGRAEWEIFRTFKCTNLHGIMTDEIADGDIVCQVDRLPLRQPRYSYKIGSQNNGHFQVFFRPTESEVEADVRADLIVALVREAERIIAAARAADRMRGTGTMAPRIGKTERDRAKHHDPANKTNDPRLSQSMRGASGGGGGKRSRG